MLVERGILSFSKHRGLPNRPRLQCLGIIRWTRKKWEKERREKADGRCVHLSKNSDHYFVHEDKEELRLSHHRLSSAYNCCFLKEKKNADRFSPWSALFSEQMHWSSLFFFPCPTIDLASSNETPSHSWWPSFANEAQMLIKKTKIIH